MLRFRTLCMSCMICWAGSGLAQDKKPTQADLEKQFSQTLSGATLVGHYIEDGQKTDKPLKEEKYFISQVSKIKGDLWLFQVRIKYGKHDVTVPLPLQVKWAGTTPIITVAKVGIPGLGTFDARVVIHNGRYSGVWDGAGHGGHLFGKIVKKEVKKEPGKKDAKKEPGKKEAKKATKK